MADLVVEQIEQLIVDNVFKPGQLLPSERRLISKLGISRSALREGLHILRTRGMIYTEQGRGSFVANLLSPEAVHPMLHLMQTQKRAIFDLLELRELLESEAAGLAAERGTSADYTLIRKRYDALCACIQNDGALQTLAELDHAFHLAICEASHNPLLVHLLSSLNDLTLKSVHNAIYHLYPQEKYKQQIDRQHAKLYTAVTGKMPEQARKAARDHLQGIRKNLQQLEQETSRLEQATRRLEGWS